MKQYLLYQAYGNIAIINECKFALLRTLKIYEEASACPDIIIYTDKPEEFKKFRGRLSIIIRTITSDDLKKWRGEINFVHRVKIEVIKDCLKNFPGKVIYADTDTYCLQPLAHLHKKITPANVFFHQYEGTIDSAGQFRKWKKFLANASISEVADPSPLHIQMWNAGVIGLEEAHSALLNEVLAITDRLYPQFPKHIVEQFSFCYTFQKRNITISDATPYFFHYWDLKEFRELLNKFFEKYRDESIDSLVKRSDHIFPEKILADKLTFANYNSVKKLLLHLSGSAWRIRNYKI